jgi:hypothetical protein
MVFIIRIEMQTSFPDVVPSIYGKVYPDWTCGAPTPDRGGTLQHRRGLDP